MCTGHYQRWKKFGDPLADQPLKPMRRGATCSVAGCGRPHQAKGLCFGHWARLRYGGDLRPEAPFEPRGETDEERLWRRVDRSGGPNVCWPWTGPVNHAGYGRLRTASGRKMLAHRLAWKLTHGSLPDEALVCHHCDNPPCCNPRCLFLGSRADNNADRDAKGRTGRGERDRHAKLTADVVRAMRERYSAGGVTFADLAMEHGVSEPAVRQAVRRQSWRHVD